MSSELAYITIAEWIPILSQVFGGCCSNVFILENILTSNKLGQSLGLIITFCHFLMTTFMSYLENADFKNGSPRRLWIRPNKVPISKWLVSVVMYFSVSVMNNLVYKFNMSVPLYTIFRSSSSVVTMITGYTLCGKTYTKHQVASSLLISLGIVVITIRTGSTETHFDYKFAIGVSLLAASSFIGSFMGIYNESIYKQYGNQWQESLFYTHLLGLPLFTAVAPVLRREMKAIVGSNKTSYGVPKQVINLLANVFSQLVCIRGVNKLAGRTTSLSVAIVLLVRKVVSLMLSIWWYENPISSKEVVGGIMVLIGTVYYSLSAIGKKGKKVTQKEVEKKDE